MNPLSIGSVAARQVGRAAFDDRIGMTALFRAEAVEAWQQTALGHAQVVRPVALSVLTAFVAVAALAAGAFLWTGHYTRKAHVGGVLVPDRGLIRLLPPLTATVAEVHARDGQTVQRGDVLFVLSVDRDTSRGDTQTAVQASLAERRRSLQEAVRQQALLHEAQRAGMQRRIADMQAELAQIDAEARLHEERLALARQALERWRGAAARQLHLGAAAAVACRGAARRCRRSARRWRASGRRSCARSAASKRSCASCRCRPACSRAASSATSPALAQQSAESLARQRIVVRAPQAGVLANVLAEVGQTVGPTAALAGLLPAGAKLQAQLYAPSSAVGFLHAGQPVLLRYQAYPYQKFGHHPGTVVQVSTAPLQAGELASLALPTPATGAVAAVGGVGEPLYRVTVALERQSIDAYGRAQPLVAGMQLDADVLLDRRRLVEWLFEPVLGLAGRL